MQAKRRWKTIVGLMLVAAFSCALAWRWAQQHARVQVTTQLEALNAAPVKIEAVRPGLLGIGLSGIQLLELGENPAAWMTIEHIHVRIPIWKALSATPVPEQIFVERPIVYLRFDRDGKLLNRFAKIEGFQTPIARTDVHDGRVEVTQEGRASLIAGNIELQLQAPGDQLQVDGTIGSLLDTKWEVEAEVDSNNLSTRLRVSAAKLKLDSTRLVKQPFVPEGRLAQLHIRGQTSASLSAKYVPEQPLEYLIALEPSSLLADIPALKIRLRQVAGKLLLKDGVLTAEQLSCDVLDGSMGLQGELDLRQRPFRGQCAVTINNIALNQFPAEWSISQELAGVYSGTTDLRIVLDDHHLILGGNGEGAIAEAMVFGLPASPIRTTVDLNRLSYDFAESAMVADGTLRLDLQMDEIAVRDALPRLKVSPDRLPVTVDGNAAVTAHLDVPLKSFGDAATYRGAADISFAELSVAGQPLRNVRIQAGYAEGVGNLHRFVGHFDGSGRIYGSGGLRVRPPGSIQGEVTVEQMPVAVLIKWSRQRIENTGGAASGSFRLSGSTENWRRLRTWEISGDVRSNQLTVLGQMVSDASAQLRLQQGVLSFAEVRAAWKGTTIRGTGTIQTESPHSFGADFSASETSLSALLATLNGVRLPEGVHSQVTVSGNVRGQIAPLAWSAAGMAHVRDAKLGQVAVPDTEVEWQVAPNGARLTANRLTMYGGQIDIDAEVPFQADGASSATVTARGVDLGQAVTAAGGFPIELIGKADGVLTLSNFDDSEKLAANVHVTGASTRLGAIPVDQWAGDVNVKDGMATYRLSGGLLGGEFGFVGSGRLKELTSDRPHLAGRLTLREARLGKLPNHMSQRWQGRLKPLRGQLDAEMNVRASGPDFRPQGEGSITLREVRWDRQELTSMSTAKIVVTPAAIQIQDFFATAGNGSLRGQLRANFDAQRSGSFDFTATRVNAKRMLASWPDAARYVEGTLNAQIRGNLGPNWAGTGYLTASRSKVMGVPVSFTRVPIDWTFSPASAGGRVKVRKAAVQLARGRATAKTTIDWGRTVNVTAEAKLASLDTKSLLRPASGVTGTGGRLSGKLQLHGRNVRSFNNLQGSFTGILENAQVLRFPVLQTVNQFLDTRQVGSARFNSSEVKLRLSRGVFRIDRLALANSGAQLLIDGNVTARGRLDLDVTAHVGQFEAEPQLRRLLRSAGLLAQPAAPVALLAEANRFLSDRLIFIHVGGTVRSPTTRLRAAPLLQQEAVRFFLKQAVPGAL